MFAELRFAPTACVIKPPAQANANAAITIAVNRTSTQHHPIYIHCSSSGFRFPVKSVKITGANQTSVRNETDLSLLKLTDDF